MANVHSRNLRACLRFSQISDGFDYAILQRQHHVWHIDRIEPVHLLGIEDLQTAVQCQHIVQIAPVTGSFIYEKWNIADLSRAAFQCSVYAARVEPSGERSYKKIGRTIALTQCNNAPRSFATSCNAT